ncbi:hypothetical protein ACOSP7_022270 [Xanthoceras sorbifolium]
MNYFIGFKVFRNSTGLYLTQSKYTIDLLKRTNMFNSKPSDSHTTTSLKLALHDDEVFSYPTLYYSTIGALQYLTYTRPDISYIVNKLSQFLVSPKQTHWQACKRMLRYLRGSIHKGLWFKPALTLSLEAYSDADWASSLDDCRSTSGNCLFLCGNLISWSSRKQTIVARSSAEAKYHSMANLTAEIMWLHSLFCELHIPLPSSTVFWCDNVSANALAYNPVFNSRIKHVDIDTHFIYDKVTSGIIEPRYVPTEFQVANVFTKGLSRDCFHFLCSKLNLVCSPQFILQGHVKILNSSVLVCATKNRVVALACQRSNTCGSLCNSIPAIPASSYHLEHDPL